MDGQGQGGAGGQGGGVQGGVLEGGQDRPHLPSLGRLTGHVTDSQGARFLTHPGSVILCYLKLKQCWMHVVQRISPFSPAWNQIGV